MASIVELNQDNFNEVTSKGVVMVDFWATWCNPCKMLGKILDGAALQMSDDVVIGKVNVDDNRELAAKFEVLNLPRIFVFKDGEIVADLSGVQSKPKLLSVIEEAQKG